MDRVIDALEILREQIELALENAAQGARESHESWSLRADSVETAGRLLSPEILEEIQEERRHEMLCLGQAAGLAWVGMRIATILQEADGARQTRGWDHQQLGERETLIDR